MLEHDIKKMHMQYNIQELISEKTKNNDNYYIKKWFVLHVEN